MPYTTEQRRQLHKKQERKHVKEGTPTINDLQDGVPTLRRVEGKGLIEFTRDGNSIYKKTLDKVATRPVSNATSAEEADTPQFGDTDLSDPGYVTFSNGFMIQWGFDVSTQSAEETFFFPTPFANECFSITTNITEPNTKNALSISSIDKTKFIIDRHGDMGGGDKDFNYIAVGN